MKWVAGSALAAAQPAMTVFTAWRWPYTSNPLPNGLTSSPRVPAVRTAVRPARSVKGYPWLPKYWMIVRRAATVAGVPAGWLGRSTTGWVRELPFSARVMIRFTQYADDEPFA